MPLPTLTEIEIPSQQNNFNNTTNTHAKTTMMMTTKTSTLTTKPLTPSSNNNSAGTVGPANQPLRAQGGTPIPPMTMTPPSPTDAIAQRELQVNAMIAGKSAKADLSYQVPKASEKTMAKFENRNRAFTFGKGHCQTQRRLAFLADLKPEKRFEAFEMYCWKKAISASTAETYWGAWRSAMQCLELPPYPPDVRVMRIMKMRCGQQPRTKRIIPLTMENLDDLVEYLVQRKEPSIAAIAMMTFILGQRIGDMIQLATEDFSVEDKHLTITVRRSKVISSTKGQPYALFLMRRRYPAETLVQCVNHARTTGRRFLLTFMNSEKEQEQIKMVIREAMHDIQINEEPDMRSFRRGGLQLMAKNGVQVQTILHHSRHSDEKMLDRYLDWGAVSTEKLETSLEMIASQTQDMRQREVRKWWE